MKQSEKEGVSVYSVIVSPIFAQGLGDPIKYILMSNFNAPIDHAKTFIGKNQHFQYTISYSYFMHHIPLGYPAKHLLP